MVPAVCIKTTVTNASVVWKHNVLCKYFGFPNSRYLTVEGGDLVTKL